MEQMLNAFEAQDVAVLVQRIQNLKPDSQALWGKMSVAQMLAHCNVTYEMVYEDKHPKPNWFKRFLLKALIKNIVVNDKPYKQNSQTAPEFIIADSRAFEAEKARLLAYIQKTLELGGSAFAGRESHSFGPLTQKEWSNLFVKHLDHHLAQFGC